MEHGTDKHSKEKPAAATGPLPAKVLVHHKIFEVRLVFRLHVELDAVLHAPVQHLVVDRKIQLIFLNLCPDLADDGVTLGKVGFRLQATIFAFTLALA